MTWTIQPRSKSGDLAYVETGSGPLVVLIHGVGLRAEAWGAQIDGLARSHRVCAVDMLGHGESARLCGNPALADYSDAIAEIITEPALVIGHSFGAMIALDMAARMPEKLRGAAALNGIYRRSPEAKQAVATRANSLDGRTVADPTPTLDRWFGNDATPARIACEHWLRVVDPAGYRDAYRVFATEDGPTDAALRAIKCPSLFLTGAQEPNSTPAMSDQMAALAPFGQSITLAGAAHMMPMTHASEVNAILDRFNQEVRQ
ncbi:MAG: alpha/beta hydrolase [Yoonia sp.]|nr:alpha/beta hydrolase [Yoonia sp.]MDG1862383.1 alpha/beta hydrolase [Yoonia sp.]